MKKLVSLAVLVLAVVVMAGMAQAANESRATISGTVNLSTISSWLCNRARITNTNAAFISPIYTLSDGTYRWYRDGEGEF